MPVRPGILRHARKTVVFLLGVGLVLVGLVLLVLPGPGALVALVGLGLLSAEFTIVRRWRNRLLRVARRRYQQSRARRRTEPPSDRPRSNDSLRQRPM